MAYPSKELWYLCTGKDNRNRTNRNYLRSTLSRIISKITKQTTKQRNPYRKFNIQIAPTDQWLSNLSVHQNHLEGLVGLWFWKFWYFWNIWVWFWYLLYFFKLWIFCLFGLPFSMFCDLFLDGGHVVGKRNFSKKSLESGWKKVRGGKVFYSPLNRSQYSTMPVSSDHELCGASQFLSTTLRWHRAARVGWNWSFPFPQVG